MSGSESGMMTSREPVPFTMGLQNSPVQNIRLAFDADGTAVYKPVAPSSPPPFQPSSSGAGDGSGGGVGGSSANAGLNMNMSGGEPVKRKRGRPRKYGPDNAMSLALIPGALPFTVAQSAGSTAGLPSPPPASSGGATSHTFKKARGRPPGSRKKHQLQAFGSTGLGFTPHVITVKAGEDVSSKILAFSQHGPRAVCVLSANGAISNVTLRQPATSGGTVTYEGRFEILSLTGSLMLTETEGHRSRSGGLSVSLSGADGRVLGGGVAGLLIAASPVQVVAGSFILDGRKDPKPVSQMNPSLPRLPPGQPLAGPSSPQSRGTMSESSGGGEGPGSPLNQQTTAPCNNSNISTIPWK